MEPEGPTGDDPDAGPAELDRAEEEARAEAQARLFQSALELREEEPPGTGLLIVHGVAAQSGGFLSVDSAPGEGTRVSIYLPPVRTAADG